MGQAAIRKGDHRAQHISMRSDAALLALSRSYTETQLHARERAATAARLVRREAIAQEEQREQQASLAGATP